jgi:hypothetical protein
MARKPADYAGHPMQRQAFASRLMLTKENYVIIKIIS